MDTVAPNIEPLLARLLDISEQLYAWRDDVRAIMEDMYLDPNYDDASDEDIFREAHKRVDQAPMQAGMSYLNDLSDAYLNTSDEQRVFIRSALSLDIVLLNFIHTYIDEARKVIESVEQDKMQALRRALAAASMQENRIDVNTMTVLLSNLLDSARAQNIDVDPHIYEIAEMSDMTPSPRAYGYSMQDFIKTYATKR